MKTIFRMARMELRNLFYSPIAWMLLVIFSIQTGLAFVEKYKMNLMYQGEGHLTHSLTGIIFSGEYNGLFVLVENSLFLYIPLLTMGLISREFSSGTIKLLYSSPVRTGQIVMGKFLAIMTYWVILMGCLLLIVMAGRSSIEALDVRLLLSGLLGILLLACAYSAIGLFMSCLTTHQVVAAISTLVLLALLNFIGSIGAGTPYLQDITYFLDAKGHAMNLVAGLLVSKDIIYFILMMAFFLILSVIKLKGEIESASFPVVAGRYVLTAGCLFILGYVFSQDGMLLYKDVTLAGSNTLAPASQEVLKNIKGPVRVTLYDNYLGEYLSGIASIRNKSWSGESWSKYRRFVPGITLKKIRFYDTVENGMFFKLNPGLPVEAVAKIKAKNAKESLDGYLPPAEIHKLADLKFLNNNSVIQMEYGTKKLFVRTGPPHDLRVTSAEASFTTAFKRLVDEHTPKIGLLTGHHERSIQTAGDESYHYFFNDLYGEGSMVNLGFDVTGLSPDKEIPGDIDILVIADPTSAYPEDQVKKVQRFIASGGNLLIAGKHPEILNPLVDPLGVRFMDGMLVQQSEEHEPDLVFAGFAAAASRVADRFAADREDNRTVYMKGAVGLQYTSTGPFTVSPVLVTDSSNTWNKMGKFKLDTGQLSFNPGMGDNHRSLPVALALTRQLSSRQQRIILLGDADLISNDAINKQRENSINTSFVRTLFNWFCYGEYPLEISRPLVYNKMLLSHKQLRTMKILLVGLWPGLLLLGGSLYLIRRKRM